jgi:CxxC-x17-CxxC domain-containing protein
MSFDTDREMHTTTCGDCGNECQVPFEPKEGRPVYCRECYPNHKPARRSDRFGGSGGFGRPRFGGGRFGGRSSRPREMHDATCGDCGNECQVPFQPKEGRPVYCRECYPNHREN